jgi:hypothetical protein
MRSEYCRPEKFRVQADHFKGLLSNRTRTTKNANPFERCRRQFFFRKLMRKIKLHGMNLKDLDQFFKFGCQFAVVAESRDFILSTQLALRSHVINECIFLQRANDQVL